MQMIPNDLAARVRKAERTRRFKQVSALLAVLVVAAGSFFAYNAVTGSHNQVQATTIATSTPAAPDAYANVSLIGKAAIVYDLSDGQTLYAQNANAQLPLASLTKLLTIYAAANVLTPDSPVTMGNASPADIQDAADIGFNPGETFNFEDLARLTLAASSNVGADAIASAAAQEHSQDPTSLLASAASALGLTQTYANNGSGLDIDTETSGGYGSAHDIALLAGALLAKDPQIAEASTLPSISATSEQGVTHTFANTDINVTHIPNLLLSKTGYTDLAGGNLVIVYDAGINHPVAIAVLGSTESGRFTDVENLLAATEAHFAGVTPAPINPAYVGTDDVNSTDVPSTSSSTQL